MPPPPGAETASADGGRACAGFSFLEVMMLIALVGILAAFALPADLAGSESANRAAAGADIERIEMIIARYRLRHQDELPRSLDELGLTQLDDPWGRAYHYRPFDSDLPRTLRRQDRQSKPLNSDYDLYSDGADGASAPALGAPASRDDIIRAADGRFVGAAMDYAGA